MLLRDELFLNTGFQHQLYSLLESACQEEQLCRLMYVPPGQCSQFVETGHIQELNEHWLVLDNYSVPHAGDGFGLASDKVIHQSTLHIPTKSVIGIEVGSHPDLIAIQKLLDKQRQKVREAFGMTPESATGHLPEAWMTHPVLTLNRQTAPAEVWRNTFQQWLFALQGLFQTGCLVR